MATDQRRFARRLGRYYGYYTGGFAAFVLLLALAERLGLPPRHIGYAFLIGILALYTSIGILSRTADLSEYYVAGRRVPAVFNGMASAAAWISVASFLGLAGALYFEGFQGLAFVIGWTGGYVLVALLFAPYLRRFGQFTIPDFLAARYGGHLARTLGAAGVILVSFIYLVAQIYGVGIITSRFVGLTLELGVFVGLAGVLLCAFLGGMRAVTWTQAAQYVIVIAAYLVPVLMMSWQASGSFLAPLVQGRVLEAVAARERALFDSPEEREARQHFRERAAAYEARIATLPHSLEAEREALRRTVIRLREVDAGPREIATAARALAELPATPEAARERWSAARAENAAAALRPAPHAQAFAAAAPAADKARRNFIALTLCLMIGIASLPHILMRYYTTPSVRDARQSVFWSLLFVCLLYLTAPAYALFAKWEVYDKLVGASLASPPAWLSEWLRLGLIAVVDANGDGRLQLAELRLDIDAVVLAAPEIAGLPHVVAGLVAAGGLAAALSTADGLLLAIANAFSHDIYFKMIDPGASTQRRLVLSKMLLLVAAVAAAWVASLRPDDILFLVSLALSFAAATFFPALVLGIFWKRANRWGAVCGMLAGFGLTLHYALATHPFFGGGPEAQWFGIAPIAAGIFGIPVGFAASVIASLLTPPPQAAVQDLVERVRYPSSESDEAAE